VSSPRELERDFAAALLGGAEESVVAEIEGDGLDPAARLAIYRHHVFTTLTEALEATYPVVVRLVDRRFFAMRPTGTSAGTHRRGRACLSTANRSRTSWRRSRRHCT
jgi:hypothetical protein